MDGGVHLRVNPALADPPDVQARHVERLVENVKPIAAEAAKLDCQVALYNHGGWGGIPENEIQVVERLRQDGITNVGMVYTQHHGHGEIGRFAELFPKMKPYLLAIALNSMITDGDLYGHNFGTAPMGQGDQDLRLLRIINESGWRRPVGMVLEVPADAEVRLQTVELLPPVLSVRRRDQLHLRKPRETSVLMIRAHRFQNRGMSPTGYSETEANRCRDRVKIGGTLLHFYCTRHKTIDNQWSG